MKINNWQYTEFEELTSTNDEAKKALPGDIISTLHQTNGRGRRGRAWESVAGNLFFSFNIEVEPDKLGQLIFVVGLSLLQTIKKISSNQELNLKWPNDVLINGKKTSGVLIERSDLGFLTVGIGVNIMDSPKLNNLIYPATSLKEEGVNTDRISFLKLYIDILDKNLYSWKQSGFGNIKEAWLQYAKNLGQKITVKNDNKEISGIFKGVDDNGLLLLETKNGLEKIITGDVS